jgi:hypothetical protein
LSRLTSKCSAMGEEQVSVGLLLPLLKSMGMGLAEAENIRGNGGTRHRQSVLY